VEFVATAAAYAGLGELALKESDPMILNMIAVVTERVRELLVADQESLARMICNEVVSAWNKGQKSSG
jgi:hypothetical protein